MATETASTTSLDSDIHSGGDLSGIEGPVARWYLDRVEAFADEPAVYVRREGTDGEHGPFAPKTYREVAEEARAVAGGLLEHVAPGDRVAVRAETRYEWTLLDHSCLLAGLVLVPVYPSFSPEQTEHVLTDSGARVLVAEDPESLPIEARESVEVVIDIEALPTGEAPDPLPGLDAAMDDTFTIVYTSGTTGMPKGVVITHQNLLSQVAQWEAMLPPTGPGDVGPVYLPLNHIMQRVIAYAGINWGSAGAYIAVESLVEDLQAVHPETFSAVPRIYRRMYDGVRESISAAEGAKQRIGEWALALAVEYGRAIETDSVTVSLRARHAIADRLVYSTVRDQLGLGDVRYAGTGSASLDAEVLHFFWGIGVPLLEGYGATETTAALTFTRLDDFHPGTVGLPVAGAELKLAPDGEVLARGPNVTPGYWSDEANTAASFDADGWYHTGDIGEWRGEHLRIVDRKKRLQVLDTGKNVYPGPVENTLRRSPFVADAMVVAEGRKYVTAILQPNYDLLLEFAAEEGIAVDADACPRNDLGDVAGVPEELLDERAVRDLFQREVDAANETLADYERVKRFDLLPAAFAVESEELTPTLKKRRGTIEERHADRIEGLYA
ncbi:AMP-dependent synthetase/ligase [Haloglomus litoreum]|uniref:AMP-dependent synthetase/ligase n=1 Tax=Haloglomus litoreum TaxID=3034026 RepID=UPI0023E76A2E|nr:long-chain fatty acid--CoA ligase [Haloglomus sp. DT116]